MINGFSKLSNVEKVQYLTNLSKEEKQILINNFNSKLEKLTENVIGSFSLPLSIVPNCLINNQSYFVPMVTEESSIVAACANAFKFISLHEGFESKVVSNLKKGNIYFDYIENLETAINQIDLLNHPEVVKLNESMVQRNAGLLSINYEQVDVYLKLTLLFNTDQAMGANFINTVLEKVASIITEKLNVQPIMSILSNNYDTCLTESRFRIPLDKLNHTSLTPNQFVQKFCKAMDIANLDIDRTVTHNKGFMNGVDAVLLATGQDYRAINGAIHSYATKSGKYRSISQYNIQHDVLEVYTQLPLSLGVVGGITKVHETVKINHKIIHPNLKVELLAQVIASTGLAQNFSAVSALISEGIQKGHMKMHLDNILIQLQATEAEATLLKNMFIDNHVSFRDVKEQLLNLRTKTE